MKCCPEARALESVTRTLHDIPVNSTERRALQFSFASKLVHMVDPRRPVYDQMVEAFYFLPRSYLGHPEKKIANLLRSYQFLADEYDRVLREGLFTPSIDHFRGRFELPPVYTDEKIIDTLIWKFVPFLEKGALRDATVAYRRCVGLTRYPALSEAVLTGRPDHSLI